MTTIVLLPLQDSMAQRSSGKQDQWRQYMAILVINHGIIKFISIPTADITAKSKFDVDTSRDFVHQEVKLTLAVRYQLSTLSGLDLDHVHHLPHALPQEKGIQCLPEWNE
jgi:hypothetical protein